MPLGRTHGAQAEPLSYVCVCVKACWEPCQVGNATLAVFFVVFLLFGHVYFCWPVLVKCGAPLVVQALHYKLFTDVLHSSWWIAIVHLLSHLLNERHGCCCCSSMLCVMLRACITSQWQHPTRRVLLPCCTTWIPCSLKRQSGQSWHWKATVEAAR